MSAVSQTAHTASPTINTPYILEIRHLTVVFGGRTIISGFSLSVAEGQRLFIQGPSGSGKSRLLRAISHLDPYPEGEILYNGRPSSVVGEPAWRRDICYVCETPPSFAGSPADVLSHALAFAAQRSHHGGPGDASRAESEQRLRGLALQLGISDAVLDQQWSSLSAGQRQRAHLAIAIALRPKVLLLDEPTSHLDKASTLRFEELISGLGITVLWISHDGEQIARLGGAVLNVPEGTLKHVPPACPPPATLPLDAVLRSASASNED